MAQAVNNDLFYSLLESGAGSIKDQKKKDSITQQELIKKLFILINLLQKVQEMITGHTAEDFQRIAAQSKGMAELAKLEQESTEKAIAKQNAELTKKEHASLFQKIFGGILAGLSIIIGTILCATPATAGLGATLIAVGILSAISVADPKLLQEAANGIADLLGGSPTAKMIVKMVITIAASVAAAIANPAGGLMMFLTLWNSLNPVQDMEAMHLQAKEKLSAKDAEDKAATEKAVWIANLAISIVLTIVSLATPAIVSGVKSLISAPEEIAEDIPMQNMAELGEEATGASVELVEEDNEINPIDEESNFYKKLYKEIVSGVKKLLNAKALKLIANSTMYASQGGEAATNVALGKIQLKLADIIKKLEIDETNVSQNENIRSLINETESSANSLMQNMLKTYQSMNRNVVSKTFIDQVSFAKLLAKLNI